MIGRLYDGFDLIRCITGIESSCNSKIKEYPARYVISCASRPVYRTERLEKRKVKEVSAAGSAADTERSQAESLRRARAAIRDICECSAFEYFLTLTLDKEKINRYSYADIIKKVNVWLGNRVKRKGFSYLIIPEFHKDGAIHFHGLCRSTFPMKYIDSGRKTKRGQTIYNLSEWSFGFSTAIPLDGDYAAVVSYIQKYITKDSQKIGGRWYLSGGDIRRPKEYHVDMDYCSIDAVEKPVENANVSFKYLSIPK